MNITDLGQGLVVPVNDLGYSCDVYSMFGRTFGFVPGIHAITLLQGWLKVWG